MGEHQRHVRAREQILRNETPDKRIMVTVGDKKEQEARKKEIQNERDRVNERMGALQEAKIPWFCPECDKVMKQKLDDKMYRLYNHCFDCQVKFENKLRIDGKFEEWETQKVLKNKLSWLNDQIESVEDWKTQTTPEFYNQVGVQSVEIEKEQWTQNDEKVIEMADEALKDLLKMKDEVVDELSKISVK
ncbi:hypothetical protein H8D04_00125 [bacterium]|nr:hypothetical protein [bacterium]